MVAGEFVEEADAVRLDFMLTTTHPNQFLTVALGCKFNGDGTFIARVKPEVRNIYSQYMIKMTSTSTGFIWQHAYDLRL